MSTREYVLKKKAKKELESTDEHRILALSLRPSDLDQLIGQSDTVKSIQNQVSSGRLPHFFIISGPVGAGKTTLARIIAKRIIPEAHIQEINAANKNGVDDTRDLIDKMRYKPVFPAKSKVVILDEAHQLTTQAQNALLTETEDVADHVFYIFCTSAVSKIIPGLKRRAFMIIPKPLSANGIRELLTAAFKITGQEKPETEVAQLHKALEDAGVNSPGLVLQAAERFLSGLSPQNSVTFTDDSKVDPLTLCRAVSAAQWSNCCEILKDVTKADIPALRNSLLGYLKAILLKTTGTKATKLSKAITHLSVDTIRADEGAALPLFLASVCMACDSLQSTTTVKK